MAAEPTIPAEGTHASTAAVTTDYRYAPIPEGVLYSGLSDKAVRIYGALMRHGMTPSTCYPSHARIAALIGCEKRSVQRPLRELEQAGWITRVKRNDDRGDRTSDGFVVRVSALDRAPTAHENAEGSARDRAELRADARDEREPVNESQVERENTPAPPAAQSTLELVGPPPRDDGYRSLSEMHEFEQFWNLYPKRDGKRLGRRDALALWRKMTGGERAAAVVGARHYGTACDQGLNRAKDAHRWLRDALWSEWQEPAVPDRRTRARTPADAAAAVAAIPPEFAQFLDDAPPPRPMIETVAR